MELIGPFSQLVVLDHLPLKGSLHDEQLHLIPNGALLMDGDRCIAQGVFEDLRKQYPDASINYISQPLVVLPGFIDCHTHICFGGNRSRDYAMRIAGKSYLEIARSGGGIWDTVTHTRKLEEAELVSGIVQRANRHLSQGVTTIEVKSGYGLDVEQELKMLRAIHQADLHTVADLIPTCLAAHIPPPNQSASEYLSYIIEELAPLIQADGWCKRFDIFVEDTAFQVHEAKSYLKTLQEMGFDITIHADQFSSGGASLAVDLNARSADHLEAISEVDMQALAASQTVGVALPGASIGLGMPFAPGRKLLDAGSCLAIASDWNPGSAPMGDLLTQAAIYSAAEKLSNAEVFAALTSRAAQALGMALPSGDFQAYPTRNFQDILYYQGSMKPVMVWKNGQMVAI